MSSTEFRAGGDPLGTHRVVTPRGLLPQAADVLDNSLPPFQGEVLIDVETLNIDAASFVQLEGTGRPVDQQILEIVSKSGKMHNPVTGSGGMLLGRIAALGPDYTGPLAGQPVGTQIATLVSLTLTPLRIERIVEVRHHAHQVVVQAQAMLASAAPAAVIPQDIPSDLVLSILDVCGAPALVDRLVRKLPRDATLLCIGAGKAGVLALAAARKARPDLKFFAVDRFPAPLQQVADAGLTDGVQTVDASDALAMREVALELSGGHLFDAVVNMASLPGTEMGAILACKSRGTCLFFGMATSFTRVALGAEGVGADVELIIGNGYAIGHAQDALALVRAMPQVRDLLAARLQK
jgi:L-erythro-3,5-diaminohexanoate dehydrogenase